MHFYMKQNIKMHYREHFTLEIFRPFKKKSELGLFHHTDTHIAHYYHESVTN